MFGGKLHSPGIAVEVRARAARDLVWAPAPMAHGVVFVCFVRVRPPCRAGRVLRGRSALPVHVRFACDFDAVSAARCVFDTHH